MPKYTGNSKSHTIRDLSGGTSSSPSCANTMRLFGLPYQFIESVDPRLDSVSVAVGRNYVEKIITDAPTVIIIPGKAKFLPGNTNKQGTSHALLSAANGKFDDLFGLLSNDAKDVIRYYDFEEDYTTYMKYVNIMCRTVATFLELTEIVDGVALNAYDWRNYRWNRSNYYSAGWDNAGYAIQSVLHSIKNAGSAIMAGFKGQAVTQMAMGDLQGSDDEGGGVITRSNNFVQFYVDPSSGASQSMSNGTSQSQIKAAMDTASSAMKEFQFVANSADIGMEGLNELTDSGLDALTESLGGGNGQFGTVMNQLLSAGRSVIKGENIILPEVYQNSDYGIDYTIDIHLRSPYGNRYSVYMDVIVPLLHLMALCIPKQTTGNTYGSPFLIKAYYPGVFNCNLGIVESMQITRPSTEDAFSVDGLPMEVDVQLRIKDLYSDLMMSPSNEPNLFINNTSLIDYLATVSGLDLISPQIGNKMNMIVSTYTRSVADIDENAKSVIMDSIEKRLSGFISL